MTHFRSLICLLVLASSVSAQEVSKEEKDAGFVSMFNGKDLTGWMYLGKGDGTFSVQDGAIHYKGGNGWLCYTVKEYDQASALALDPVVDHVCAPLSACVDDGTNDGLEMKLWISKE